MSKNAQILPTWISDDQPFTYRPYRLSAKEKELVRGLVGELQKNNILQKFNSPYSSSILLVKKKNSESRLCIDYRMLNSLPFKDRYPVPGIDDQLNHRHGCALDFRLSF